MGPGTLCDWRERNFKTEVDFLKARLEQTHRTTTTLISVAEQQLQTIKLINTDQNYCKLIELVQRAANALADVNIVLIKDVVEAQEVCNNNHRSSSSSEAFRAPTPGSVSDRQPDGPSPDTNALIRSMPTPSTDDASETPKWTNNVVDNDRSIAVESTSDEDATLADEDKQSTASEAAGSNRSASVNGQRNLLTLRSVMMKIESKRAGRAATDVDDDDDEFSMALPPKKQEDSSVEQQRREPLVSMVSRSGPSRLETDHPVSTPRDAAVENNATNGTRDDDDGGGGEQGAVQKRLCSSPSVGAVAGGIPMGPTKRRSSQPTENTDANNEMGKSAHNSKHSNSSNSNNSSNSRVGVQADRTAHQNRVVDVQRGGSTEETLRKVAEILTISPRKQPPPCAGTEKSDIELPNLAAIVREATRNPVDANEEELFVSRCRHIAQVESPPSASISDPASRFVAGKFPKDPFQVRQPDLYNYVEVVVPSIHMDKKRVYVNIWPDAEVLEEISQELRDNYPVQEISADELCENETLVIACLGGEKYRARFLRLTKDGKAEVYFLDFGNTDFIPLKEIRLLKTKRSLKTCQLAFPCQLSSRLDQMKALDLLGEIQETHTLSMCFSGGSEVNDRGERVYTIEDIVPRKVLTNLMPMPKSLAINERVGHVFSVCHVVNPKEIWLLDHGEVTLRIELQMALEQLPLPPCVPPSTLSTGSYVVRQSKRARILAVHGDVVDLFMLDSGHTLTGVPVQECRMPPLVTFTLPPSAIKVSLAHCTYNELNWTEAERKKMENVFSNRKVKVRCIGESSEVILIDGQTQKRFDRQIQSLGLCT